MQIQSTVFSPTALLLLFIPAYLSSQDVSFEKLPEFDLTELGYGGVTDITQDPEGYMWFATLNGLYRYDGYQIITYQNDNSNPQSLALNHLNSVYADQDGLIWIGTVGRGVDCLNPKTGVFKNYRHQPNDKASICNDTINTIRGDKSGFLWIGTMNGLNYFNTRTGKSTRYRFNKNDPNSISDNEVRVIYKDKAGTNWFGTRSGFSVGPKNEYLGGLNRFNPETGNFTRYVHSPNDSKTLIDNRVTAIFEDSKGVFWVGTSGDGLHTMDRTTGAFERHTYDNTQPGKLSRPPVRNTISYTDDFISFINEDATKKIWIGTMSGGINRYDPVTQKMTFFNETTDPVSGLTADCCYFTSFVSRDSVFWIAAWLGAHYWTFLKRGGKSLIFVFSHDIRIDASPALTQI